MIQIHLSKRYVLGFCCSSFSCIAAKYNNVKQRVAHQTVSSVDSSDSLACYKQVVYRIGEAFAVDFQTAVLIMQGRINQNRLFSHIDTILHEHTEHSRDSLLDGSFSVKQIDHRGIQPYSLALRSLNALVAVVGAFTNNACCGYVTGFQRMHESFAVYVYEHCAKRTYFLSYQSTEDLGRVSSSGRMVLNGILIQKRSTCTVSEDQTVSGCTVMVRGWEVVVVKASCTTSCNDNCFCFCYLILSGLHVLKNSTGNLSLIVFDQLYCG